MERLFYEFMIDVYSRDEDGDIVDDAFCSVPVKIDILRVEGYRVALDESGEATRTAVFMQSGENYVLNITYKSFDLIMAKLNRLTLASQAAVFRDC